MPYQKFTHFLFSIMLLFCYSINIQADMVKRDVYLESKMYGHSETSAIKQIVLDDFEGSDFVFKGVKIVCFCNLRGKFIPESGDSEYW